MVQTVTTLPEGAPAGTTNIKVAGVAGIPADAPGVLVGKKAYVLRPDGTAFEVHELVKGPKGWFAHGYEACADGSCSV